MTPCAQIEAFGFIDSRGLGADRQSSRIATSPFVDPRGETKTASGYFIVKTTVTTVFTYYWYPYSRGRDTASVSDCIEYQHSLGHIYAQEGPGARCDSSGESDMTSRHA